MPTFNRPSGEQPGTRSVVPPAPKRNRRMWCITCGHEILVHNKLLARQTCLINTCKCAECHHYIQLPGD